MTFLNGFLYFIAAVLALLLLAGRLGWLAGQPPTGLGVQDGKLKRPSRTPNSVSSQADLWPGPMSESARIDPLTVKGSPQASLQQIKALAAQMPGARVVDSRDDYLYLQFTTRVLGFVDDVEFWAAPDAKVIQVRSASRVGRKDFGVNRARIEALRGQFAAAS